MGELRKRIGASMDMQKPQEGRETLKYLGGGRITTGGDHYIKYEYVAPDSDVVAVSEDELIKFLKGSATLYSSGGSLGMNVDFSHNTITYEIDHEKGTIPYSQLADGRVGVDLHSVYALMSNMSSTASYGGIQIPVEHWTDEEERAKRLLDSRNQRNGVPVRRSKSIGQINQE